MIVRTSCPQDGEVDLEPPALVMDPDDMTYRFRCPECGSVVTKRMDRKIQRLLQKAGVLETEDTEPELTIDEIVEAEAAVLEDDTAIWRGILS